MTTAVQTRGLGKRYRLSPASYGNVREAIASGARRLVRTQAARAQHRELWALRHLDLEVEEGEAVGIVGRNGAGKTTLLRILTGITEPSEGFARMRGRVGALLEVGTGFHPELTGRENVYLNAALLGLSRRETSARFDEIVEFAGVERFLDTQLKHYSTGMGLRLAFAVAAHIEPDVLLVDEVLAVGDLEFQRRCLGRVSDLGREGRTAIVVSHDLGTVARLCSRAVWLERGVVRHDGPAAETVERYRHAELGRAVVPVTRTLPGLELVVSLLDAQGDPLEAPRRDEPFQVAITFELTRSVRSLDVGVKIVNADGIRLLDEVWSDQGEELLSASGRQSVAVRFPPVLTPGNYVAGIWIGNDYEDVFNADVLPFAILPKPDDRDDAPGRRRLIAPPVRWHAASWVDSS